MMKFLATLFTLSAWFRARKYKSGTGWCVWRWTDVESEYILRLHLVKTPWFAVCLHWIRKADKEPWLHDHPVSFLSLILRGKYTELRKTDDGKPYHKVNRWFNVVRASRSDRHRIILARCNTLTLCFMGPKVQEWGFYVWEEIEPGGWIMWKDYYARLKAGEDMRKTKVALATMAAAAKAADKLTARFCAIHGDQDYPTRLEDDVRRTITTVRDTVVDDETHLLCRECRERITEADFTDEEVTEPRS
jgi:hypothetical protein